MAKGQNAVSQVAEENDWMAENDLRTLIDAEKIKADPKRMKAAMKKQTEMKKALEKIR